MLHHVYDVTHLTLTVSSMFHVKGGSLSGFHSCIMPLASYHSSSSTVVDIEFDPTNYTVNEDDGTVILIVQKTGENEIPVTVDISTSTGSAGGMHTCPYNN